MRVTLVLAAGQCADVARDGLDAGSCRCRKPHPYGLRSYYWLIGRRGSCFVVTALGRLVDRIRQHTQSPGSPLRQCSIWGVFVVVSHVLGQDVLEMTTTEDEESVEALSVGRANKTSGERLRRALGRDGTSRKPRPPAHLLASSAGTGTWHLCRALQRGPASPWSQSRDATAICLRQSN